MMKIKLALVMAAITVASVTTTAAQAENKVASGAKAVGNGILWLPKKVGSCIVKGGKAVGNGMKKAVGKGK